MGKLVDLTGLNRFKTDMQTWTINSSNKVNKPTTSPNGTSGQLLRTNGDGSTTWVDVGLPTDAQTAQAVEDWLEEHPEATTTVADGAVTYAKLDTNLKGHADAVSMTENSSTASVEHPVNDSFFLNGILYEATIDIPENGTIVPGTNCKPINLGHDVSTIKRDIISIQDEEPTEPLNKIWINETPSDEIQIPTYNEFNDLKSAIEEIADYPDKSKTVVITSSDFVQGYRHNQPNAEVKNDAGYTTTKDIIHFKSGDVFTHPTDQNVMYFFVTSTGAFYETYVASPYTIPVDIDLYLDCGKSGITPQTTPTVQYTKDTIIKNIVECDEALQSQIDSLKTNFPALEVCYKQGDSSVLRGYHVRNGALTQTVDSFCCTIPFIPCKTGEVFLLLNANSISKYSTNNDSGFLSIIENTDLPLYSGNARWNVWIADFTGYVRFSMYWTEPVMCAVSKINLTDYPYKCVCLGDSVFGNNQKPNDLPTYMQEVTSLQTANCGFGGTEAATHFNPIYTPLSFWSIADAINSGDWSDIDVDWYTINNDHVFMANVYILCHLVDWSKIRTLTVAYGTNDWNAGVSIDNENNPKDVTTFKGALRYGIEKIQAAYPKINIILLSPLYRYWSNSQDYLTVDDDSDNRVVDGRKLYDYVTAIKEVAEEYHLPYYDNYNTAGLNKITAPSILRDGTHLNYKYGVSMVGKHIGAEVALSNQRISADTY